MEIVNVDIKTLKPAEYNPRKASKSQYNDLKKSLKEFGFVDPLIVNSAESRKNIVIGGHFRLRVAIDMKFETVPVVYVDISDIEKEKELNLRLNFNQGEWDIDLLANIDEDLLKEVGWDDDELGKMFQLNSYGTDFDLPDGDKEPFQQITFTLADKQAELIKSSVGIAKKGNNADVFGNENSNGNALYRIVKEWAEQKT